MTGIYIHIPFCVQKCAYCDFLSFENGGKYFEAYTGAVIKELKNASFTSGVNTVYIGGGTPTALPSFLLCEILKTVKELPLIENAEITVETNPGTVDFSYLEAIKNAGANRLSIGLQTTHTHLLHEIGRIHTPEDFYETFKNARKAGFDNINIDLMFALPGQKQEEWHETLERVVALSPEHISAYSLTLAENTPLAERVTNGKVLLPDDETDRNMYHTARRVLAEAGYTHYEISNFALPGMESRHNINCWTMKPYTGFGVGAHSFDGRARWNNTEVLAEYLAGSSRVEKIHLSKAELHAEKIILGLRLMCGVFESEFSDIYKNEIEKLVKDGMLKREENRVLLTPRGMDFANRVFVEFLVD